MSDSYTKSKFKIMNDKEAYCLKCRKIVEALDPERVKMKNGVPALKGKCPEGNCGRDLYRILPRETRKEGEG